MARAHFGVENYVLAIVRADGLQYVGDVVEIGDQQLGGHRNIAGQS